MTAYCPNCGKPNTDEATNCVSCATELKKPGAAAKGRFKGTMMMTGLTPPTAPEGGGAPAQPASSQAQDMALQRTIMGPMTPPTDPNASGPQQGPGAFGQPAPDSAFGQPAPQQGFGEPPAQQSGFGAAPSQPGGFGDAPAQPAQGGFGDAPSQPGGFGAPPAQQGGFGAPPAQQGFGAPPQQGGFGEPPAQQGGFGAPPQQGGFGDAPSQPGGFGAPPAQGGFGQAPSQPGQPADGGFGQPPGGGGGFGGGYAPPPGGGAAYPPPQGAPQGGGASKVWMGVGIGCLVAVLLVVGVVWYMCHKVSSAVDEATAEWEATGQQLGAELQRISLTSTLSIGKMSCPNAESIFHPSAAGAYAADFCTQINDNVIQAYSQSCQGTQHPCSSASSVTGTADEGRAAGVGLQPQACYVFTSGSSKIVGCSTDTGFKLIHVENLGAVQ